MRHDLLSRDLDINDCSGWLVGIGDCSGQLIHSHLGTCGGVQWEAWW